MTCSEFSVALSMSTGGVMDVPRDPNFSFRPSEAVSPDVRLAEDMPCAPASPSRGGR